MKINCTRLENLVAGTPLNSELVYTERVVQSGSFLARIKRSGSPAVQLGWIQVLLLPGERVALCKDTSHPCELSLLFPFLSGSEFRAVRRHGNVLTLDSLLVTLDLESDSNLLEQAAVEISQWARIFSRLISHDDPSPKLTRPAHFDGLGIVLPIAGLATDPHLQILSGEHRRQRQLIPQTTMPTSRTMRRISLGLQKPIETSNNGFGDDLKTLLSVLDKPEEEVSVSQSSPPVPSGLELPSVPNLLHDSSPGSDRTPSPTRLYLDANTPTPPRRQSRVDTILAKEADILRSREPSIPSLTQLRDRDARRQPPNFPPPVPRARSSHSDLHVVDLNDEPLKLGERPELNSNLPDAESSSPGTHEGIMHACDSFDLDHPSSPHVLVPVSENVARPKKNARILKTVKRMLTKKNKDPYSPQSLATDTSRPLPSPPIQASLSRVEQALKPVVIAVADARPMSRTKTSAVPKLDSNSSISALSFRSFSSRSIPLQDCISEPESETETQLPPVLLRNSDCEDHRAEIPEAWSDLESRLNDIASEAQSSTDTSPVQLRRENRPSLISEPVILKAADITPDGSTNIMNAYANRSMPNIKPLSIHGASTLSGASTLGGTLAIAKLAQEVPASHSTSSSYSSIGSRRSTYSSASSLASLSAPSLALSSKSIIQEVTLYASKLWISKWQNTRWVPLCQEEIPTEIVSSAQGTQIVFTRNGQAPVTLLVQAATEIRRISVHDVEVKSTDSVYMFRGKDVDNTQGFFKTLWAVHNNAPPVMFSAAEKNNRKAMLPPLMSRQTPTMRQPLTSTIIEE